MSYVLNQNYVSQKNQLTSKVYESLNKFSDQLTRSEQIMLLKTDSAFDSIIQLGVQGQPGNVVIQEKLELDSKDDSSKRVESRIEIRMESYSDTEVNISDSIEMNFHKAQLSNEFKEYSEIIERAILESRNVLGKQFDEDSIQKALKMSLAQVGIEEDFSFAIYDKDEEKFELGSALKNPQSILLYPKDIISPKRYRLDLALHNESTLVLASMRWSLILISLLSILLITTFAYALHIISKQKKVDQMKTDFINNMTHEFKTPLASIALASDSILLESVVTDKEKTTQLIQVIKSEKEKMMGHIERVLEIASLDQDTFQMKKEPTQIADLLEKVTQGLEPAIHSKKGTIQKSFQDDLVCNIDRHHWYNAISNILDNAIKYSEQPEIEISAISKNGFIEIRVADKGAGISRESLKHVFQKFYRAESGDVHTIKGFGLGLSYVKRIVDLHQGIIEIKSELGKGTTVVIKLNCHE